MNAMTPRLTSLAALERAQGALPEGPAKQAVFRAIEELEQVTLPDRETILRDVTFLVGQTMLREECIDHGGIDAIRDRYCITREAAVEATDPNFTE